MRTGVDSSSLVGCPSGEIARAKWLNQLDGFRLEKDDGGAMCGTGLVSKAGQSGGSYSLVELRLARTSLSLTAWQPNRLVAVTPGSTLAGEGQGEIQRRCSVGEVVALMCRGAGKGK